MSNDQLVERLKSGGIKGLRGGRELLPGGRQPDHKNCRQRVQKKGWEQRGRTHNTLRGDFACCLLNGRDI